MGMEQPALWLGEEWGDPPDCDCNANKPRTVRKFPLNPSYFVPRCVLAEPWGDAKIKDLRP